MGSYAIGPSILNLLEAHSSISVLFQWANFRKFYELNNNNNSDSNFKFNMFLFIDLISILFQWANIKKNNDLNNNNNNNFGFIGLKFYNKLELGIKAFVV